MIKKMVMLSVLAGSGLTAAVAQTPAPHMPATTPQGNPYLQLMQKATAHARANGIRTPPVISPLDATVWSAPGAATVPVKALQAMGVKVVPWTTDDPAKMKELIDLGVDGVITDRPDLLRQVLAEARTAASPAERERLQDFSLGAHRGGRGLRPENTLPSFESGMDQGADSLETDTGVTSDGYSLIWHDQFLNPQSCRKADGSPYTMANRMYTKDMTLKYAQSTFICDKLHFDAEQKNDLSLSPVAVAFAKKEGMPSPYAPTYAAQLFRFVKFYTKWYKSGPGKDLPNAAERARTGARVHFNVETKLFPDVPAIAMMAPKGTPADLLKNHTFGPQRFVDVLCGEIEKSGVVKRTDVQSFDYRTLQLIEEQHPKIPTYYLTSDARLLSTDFVPASLRVEPMESAPVK
jgi:glycerophosphoryl diester phosphodiesterase